MTEIVMIGGSAGSIEALLRILPRLNDKIGVSIVIVLHRKSSQDTLLTDLLSAKTLLKVKEIEEKEKPVPGTIYIAPADYHLLVEKDTSFTLDFSERVNHSRPSIDVAIESAAYIYGPRMACIILSGANGDGTEGMKFLKKMGGLTIAQDPSIAEVAYMPEHAIAHGAADNVWNYEEIINFLNTVGA